MFEQFIDKKHIETSFCCFNFTLKSINHFYYSTCLSIDFLLLYVKQIKQCSLTSGVRAVITVNCKLSQKSVARAAINARIVVPNCDLFPYASQSLLRTYRAISINAKITTRSAADTRKFLAHAYCDALIFLQKRVFMPIK